MFSECQLLRADKIGVDEISVWDYVDESWLREDILQVADLSSGALNDEVTKAYKRMLKGDYYLLPHCVYSLERER